MSKKKLREKIKALRAENDDLFDGLQHTDDTASYLAELNQRVEKSLMSCERALMYHQERSEKAFEIIGRLMVESEMD